jgi:exodeoxyribonuclease X
MKTQAYILDLETTGLCSPVQPTEMAWIELDSNYSIKRSFLQRYKPDKPIELGSLSVAHILDEDLVNEPSYTQAVGDLPADMLYMIGHNIDYDWDVLGRPDVRRIDTKVLAMSLWPDLDTYSQSALIYYLYRTNATVWLKDAHTALAAIINNHRLLVKIIEKVGTVSFQNLWELSEKARIPTIMPFGKHKGEELKKIPKDYIRWVKSQSGIDSYLMKALNSL